MSAKLDMKKKYKAAYTAKTDPAFVDVPPFNCLMVDGEGDPSLEPWFQKAVEALYAASYTLKFQLKEKSPHKDYVVMPLEGLWWSEDMDAYLHPGRRGEWKWTLFMVQPDHASDGSVAKALDAAKAKKNNPALDHLRFTLFAEGHSAQLLHVGPYDQEGPAVGRLHAFIAESGFTPLGKHHEVYLSDPRRTAPEKLKTILRQPVRRPCAQMINR